LNQLWVNFLHINNIWIDSILRTSLLLGAACVAVYLQNLSPEIRNFIDSKWSNSQS
jgi:hypothetical protein